MAISIVCTNRECQKNLRAKDESAGKSVKCPGCGRILLVPTQSGAAKPVGAVPAPPVRSSDMHFLPRPVPSQVRGSGWPLFATAAALILLLAVALAVSVFVAPDFIRTNVPNILLTVLVGFAGVAIGGLIAHLNAKLQRVQLETEVATFTEEKRWIETAQQNLRETFELYVARAEAKFDGYAARSEAKFQVLAATALDKLNEESRASRKESAHEARANAEAFSGRIDDQLKAHADKIGGLKGSLETHINNLDGYVRELESKREGAYTDLCRTFGDFTSQSLSKLTGHTTQSLFKLTDQSRANADAFAGRIDTQLITHADKIGGLKVALETQINHLDGYVRDLEGKRQGAYEGLTRELSNLQTAYIELRDRTQDVIDVLKAGPVRGRWGEIQLERIVELAGMAEHVSYNKQVVGDDGRPDVVVRLPKEGHITIDSKFQYKAYTDAMALTDGVLRKQKLQDNASTLRDEIKKLSKRNYWEQFPPSPELVIMFIPIESCLMAAYESDPDIIEFALSQKVMLASPITLLGFLKAIAYGWQQSLVSKNAKKVLEQGKELYKRAVIWNDHYRKTGERINAVVEEYNKSVASLQARFYPACRRFQDLIGVADELDEAATVNEGVNLPLHSQDIDEPT
jgi:DNA recombination protein RmuC